MTCSGGATPASTFVEVQELKDVLTLSNRAYFQHHRFLLFFINRDVGAVNPGVGAEVPEPHVGVPERKSGVPQHESASQLGSLCIAGILRCWQEQVEKKCHLCPHCIPQLEQHS